MLRKTILTGLLAATLGAPAFAADVAGPAPIAAPAPWAFDFAFGGKLMSDYNFRGISQSARGPAINVYGEARYGWLYAGAAFWTTKLPNRPVGEVDLYAGIRPVVGDATFDLGVMYYLYPNERQFITTGAENGGLALPGVWAPARTNFVEFYGKVGYDVTPQLNVGAAVYFAPNWLGTGAAGTYVEANAKYKLPNDFAISGAIGHYFLGTTTVFGLGNFNIQDYAYWNAGVSWTYKDWMTLDLRYHGTNLSSTNCFNTTGDYRGVLTGSGRSNWCGHSVVATLSVDLQWSKLPYR
ncbi:MAG: TorF family putative porin [Phreatobacter sp.]|nr:TorF family putative porin [Phreatobacter sp.]